MYNNTTIIQRLSRGSSRGISYVGGQKGTGLNYPTIKKTDSNYYDSGILKNNSKPVYESSIKNSTNDQNKVYPQNSFGYGNSYNYSRMK